MLVKAEPDGVPVREGETSVSRAHVTVRMTEKEHDAFDGLAFEARGWARFRLLVRKGSGDGSPGPASGLWEVRDCRDLRPSVHARRDEAPVMFSGSRDRRDLAAGEDLRWLRLARWEALAMPEAPGQVPAETEGGAL